MVRALVLVALVATRAHAAPHDLVGRPIVLPGGAVAAQLTAEIDLAPKLVGRPLSLAPDVWWGASARWTVGLVHSNLSVDHIAPGASVCVVTDPLLCARAYRGSGLDARWEAIAGRLAVAPRARFLVRDVSPWKPAVTAGALVRWTRGRFAIVADPYLQLGLANRDRGNRAQLFLPVELVVQPTCRWGIALDTGWNGEVSILRDGWHIPVGVGVRAAATGQVDVAASFGFATLLGPQQTPKERAAFVTVGWRSK